LRLASAGGRELSGDMTVHTTLEPRLQEVARKAAQRTIEKQGVRANVKEAAVVVMKPDGAVSALIGGADYTESTFNRAIQAHRQPGSAFKPFVYLAALEAGHTPWEEADDTPVDIGGWTPTNFGGRSYGTLTLSEALAHSVNTITAQLAQTVGISAVVEAAKRCGITSKLSHNASLALGTSEVTPLELTSAYAVFASGGLKVHPYFVTEVDGADGRVLYKRQPPAPERVIAQQVNRDLTAMLYAVVTSGTGLGAALWDHEAAGKTGTTQDYHDAWFVGFTADYVTGVWVGNDDAEAMHGVTGGTLPAQIWKEVMRTAEKGMPATPLDRTAPEEATDEETAEVTGANLAPTDDEAARGAQPLPAQQEQRQERKHSPVGQFFNWLFGSPEEGEPSKPPEPKNNEN
jgi:penicillin-binding protein 1A